MLSQPRNIQPTPTPTPPLPPPPPPVRAQSIQPQYTQNPVPQRPQQVIGCNGGYVPLNPNPYYSVDTMPSPKHKSAPEKFRGGYDKVTEFLASFERLCAQHNVILDSEKCESLLRYCSKREKQTIKNIPFYRSKQWDALKEAILNLYDADLDADRYSEEDVKRFIKKSKTKRIRNLASWKKYSRNFIRIAGSLKSENRISEREYARYFWKGLHKETRKSLVARLTTLNPGRSLKESYTVDELDIVANKLFERNQFPKDWDTDEDSSEQESSSEEDFPEYAVPDSDSDSESERRIRKKRSKSSHRKRKSTINSDSEDEAPKSRKMNAAQREVEGIIRQLNTMKQDDPKYALAYYRAIKLDKDVMYSLRQPILTPQASTPQVTATTSTPPCRMYPNPRPPTPNSFTAPRNQMMQGLPPPRGSEMTCYGCNQKGHGVSSCPDINNLLSKGLLIKDHAGRLILGNGSPIRRSMGESILDAYNRSVETVEANLITVNSFGQMDYQADYEADYESDDESDDALSNPDEYLSWGLLNTFEPEEEVYAVSDCGDYIYAAERPATQINAKRNKVFDGVYPPQRPRIGKENRPAKPEIVPPKVNPETGRPIRTTRHDPPVINEPKKMVRIQDPKPVEIDKPRYDGKDDSQIVEDRTLKEKSNPINKSKEETPDPTKLNVKRPARQSVVSAQVDPVRVFNECLNATVNLRVGEVIAVSREIQTLFSDAIKPKTPKTPAAVELATGQVNSGQMSRFPKAGKGAHGALIKITVEYNGHPIEAIIDTGSQLNIVHERVWKQIIKLPMNMTEKVEMRDANDGIRKLHGLLENVVFDYGSVRTHASCFVGAHFPFDLLLGRPWQRNNRISIEEHEDGTYLVVRDRETGDVIFKSIVTPDQMIDHTDGNVSAVHVTGPGKIPVSLLIDAENGSQAQAQEAQEEEDALTNDYEDFDHKLMTSSEMTLAGREFVDAFRLWSNKLNTQDSNYLIINTPETSGIKEWREEDETLPTTTLSNISINSPAMELQVVPVRPQHEIELPPLLPGQLPARSQAENLLAGLGDIPYLGRLNALRDVVCASSNAVTMRHETDAFGFERIDLMMLNMGLFTPDSAGNLALVNGLADIRFYPGLGGIPENWTVPLLVRKENKRSGVSPNAWLLSTRALMNSLITSDQTESDSELRPQGSRSPSPSPPSIPVATHTTFASNNPFAPSSPPPPFSQSVDPPPPNVAEKSEPETAIPCVYCRSTHFAPCTSTLENAINLAAILEASATSPDHDCKPENKSDDTKPSVLSPPPTHALLVVLQPPDDGFPPGTDLSSLFDWKKFAEEVEERVEENKKAMEEGKEITPGLDLLARAAELKAFVDSDVWSRSRYVRDNSIAGVLFYLLAILNSKTSSSSDAEPISPKSPTSPTTSALLSSPSSPPPLVTPSSTDSLPELLPIEEQVFSIQKQLDAIIEQRIHLESPKPLTPGQQLNLLRARRLAAGQLAYGFDETLPRKKLSEMDNVPEFARPVVAFPAHVMAPLPPSFTSPMYEGQPPHTNQHPTFPENLIKFESPPTSIASLLNPPPPIPSPSKMESETQTPLFDFNDSPNPTANKFSDMLFTPPTPPTSPQHIPATTSTNSENTDPGLEWVPPYPRFTRLHDIRDLAKQDHGQSLDAAPPPQTICPSIDINFSFTSRSNSTIEQDNLQLSEAAIASNPLVPSFRMEGLVQLREKVTPAQLLEEHYEGDQLQKLQPGEVYDRGDRMATAHQEDDTADARRNILLQHPSPTRVGKYIRLGQVEVEVDAEEAMRTRDDIYLGECLSFQPSIVDYMREMIISPKLGPIRPGPKTNPAVPIEHRHYYPYSDQECHFNIMRVESYVSVNLRNMTLAIPGDIIPPGLMAVWSVLAPRNASTPIIFPGTIWPAGYGPLDVPPITAQTWGQRLDQIIDTRDRLHEFIISVTKMMSRTQLEELFSPNLTVFVLEGRKLIEKNVDRDTFFRVLHPTFNPLLDPFEATFLRGAAYFFRAYQYDSIAETIDRVLRSPQLDDYVCTNLLLRGFLRRSMRSEALAFLEEYEAQAVGERNWWGEDDDDRITTDGEEDTDTD